MRRDHCKQCELAWHYRWLLVWGAIGLGGLMFTLLSIPKQMPLPGFLLLLVIAVALNFAFRPHAKAAERLRDELRRERNS